ncbi:MULTISPECIES: signal peptidase I [unclassified Streptomyces]|uniref:signal peptidase I n=1 Tax=unclassified Streptomyces TaxID=2593676 RepID=UPI001BED19B2|nr:MULTISPECIES: signal peptidase I [unclassified Streptomyces]MBT2404112.1 signal peptidase I [Streptomyces sp. ISL-21]MBT2612694.1 signal peptidase I [Streptomyces sp. ISL-87]
MEHGPGRRRGIAAGVLLLLAAVLFGGVRVAMAVDPPARFTEGRQAGFTMTPTYTDGETTYLVPVGGGGPRRGDIVLASVPWSLEKTQMNRVVAVGGDRIRYSMGGKEHQQVLFLNGKPLEEPYLEGWKYPSTVAFDVTVPQGQVFLMADNRVNSDGSQFANNGPVPVSAVVARVVVYPMALAAVWAQAAAGLLLLVGGGLGGAAWRARGRAVRARTPAAPADRVDVAA